MAAGGADGLRFLGDSPLLLRGEPPSRCILILSAEDVRRNWVPPLWSPGTAGSPMNGSLPKSPPGGGGGGMLVGAG